MAKISYSKDQVSEILNYDRKDLFKAPPTFDWPPINFDQTREPGIVVARAVLMDERSVNLAKSNCLNLTQKLIYYFNFLQIFFDSFIMNKILNFKIYWKDVLEYSAIRQKVKIVKETQEKK